MIQFNDCQIPRVIYYASKSLYNTEKRYCQTEKEALALVWAVEIFHIYLYGMEFELLTDQKPLEAIFKPTSKPCARIERWVLRLQSYRFKIKYIQGKSNIADPLSRLCVPPTGQQNQIIDNETFIHQIVDYSIQTALNLSEISACSRIDPEILAIKKGEYEDIWSENVKPLRVFKPNFVFMVTYYFVKIELLFHKN